MAFFHLSRLRPSQKDQLNQDVGKIKAFYLNNGFINAQVGEPESATTGRGSPSRSLFRKEAVPRRQSAITGDELIIPRETFWRNSRSERRTFLIAKRS